MIHRFQAKGAPRVYLLPAAPVLLLGGSLVPFFIGQVMIGVVALAISGWISYHLIRYAVNQFKSHVRTTDEELMCLTSMGVDNRMLWSDVSHAGTFVTERAGTYLFVYNEREDELLSIPPYYSDRNKLEDTARERSGSFLSLSGSTPDDLAEALRPFLDSEEAD